MKMTKVEALRVAIDELRIMDATDSTLVPKACDAISVLEGMVAQLTKPRKISDEARAKANEKRKQASKAKRKEYVTPIIPILYDGLIEPMTAKELYAKVKDQLPTEFTAGKVQAILLSDMTDKVRKLTNGRNAMKYERI